MEERSKENNEIMVAVVGSSSSVYPNLIRAMSDLGFHLKRWTGSAEECGALCDVDGRRLRLVLLPGSRTLSTRTKEERLVFNYLVSGKPDLILNVVDATALEPDLSLTIRLMELGMPLVMALNKVGVAETRGVRLDVSALETILRIAVVSIGTRKKSDPKALLRKILLAGDNRATGRPRQFTYGDGVECASEFIEAAIGQDYPLLAKRYPLRWLVYKVMEGDPSFYGEVMSAEGCMIAEALHQLRRVHGEDLAGHLDAVRDRLAGSIARDVLGSVGAGRPEPPERNGSGDLSCFLKAPLLLPALWQGLTCGISATSHCIVIS